MNRRSGVIYSTQQAFDAVRPSARAVRERDPAKSKKGISTPKAEIDKIKRRLKEAESLAERE